MPICDIRRSNHAAAKGRRADAARLTWALGGVVCERPSARDARETMAELLIRWHDGDANRPMTLEQAIRDEDEPINPHAAGQEHAPEREVLLPHAGLRGGATERRLGLGHAALR